MCCVGLDWIGLYKLDRVVLCCVVLCSFALDCVRMVRRHCDVLTITQKQKRKRQIQHLYRLCVIVSVSEYYVVVFKK